MKIGGEKTNRRSHNHHPPQEEKTRSHPPSGYKKKAISMLPCSIYPYHDPPLTAGIIQIHILP